MPRNIGVRITDEQWEFLQSQTKNGITISEIIRSYIDQAMQKPLEEGFFPPNNLIIKLDPFEMKALSDIAEELGKENLAEVVHHMILAFHVMLKTSLHRILRPIPELADLVLSEQLKHEEK